jgi:PAS domain S-box-containing protein
MLQRSHEDGWRLEVGSMQLAYNYHSLLPLLALVVALFLVVRVMRHRTMSIALTFSVLMLAIAWWSFSVVLEHAGVGLPAKTLWMKMSYFGIVVVPAAWLVLTLQYSGREKWLTRRSLALLAMVPIITLAMVSTNDVYHLMWKDIWLDTSFSPPVDAVTHGVGFWFQAVYSYLLILLGTLALLRVFLQSSAIYRKQVGVMLVASTVPWVANFLYIGRVGLFSEVDPTPLAFAVTGAAFFWGLFRFQLLDVMPIAQEAIFRNMADGVVVVDTHDRVVELNPAAQRIVKRTRSEAVGQPYSLVVPGEVGQLDLKSEVPESQTVISMGEGQTLRYYEVNVTPILTKGQPSGHLVLLHDDTGRVKIEADARERLRLETELIERQRSEQTLRASEAKFRNLVENAAIGIVVSLPDGRVLSANRALLEVFGYDSEEDIRKKSVVELYAKASDRRRLLRLIEKTRVAKGYEVRMKRKDGTTFWASLNVITQIAESGEKQFLSLVEDVTDRKRFETDLAESRENLRLLAQRVEQAREDERTTIARELHDQVGQTFTALKLDIHRLNRAMENENAETNAMFDGMVSMVDAGADDVRRISSELRPGALDDLGLAGAIDWQLDQFRVRSDVVFTFDCGEGEFALEAAQTTALFRVFQELVTNAVRHADAKTVNVSLREEGGMCILIVADDGCGIDNRVIAERSSLGIVGMTERLLPYGGELRIEGVPGKGTTARVTMPVDSRRRSLDIRG